ncbi:putative bifunctional diguanylate cyclase/phosphodiesterase [Sphingobium sp. SYK-6]|uniref:putative bifunctional diguanylate cyclase/phosphodiesterase n=1 Tax=Sphingobium sp. (strain NBRC 103272 / SYK-6) TaxID=627192 RepID=UPI00059D0927|nr:bifunctional diguanylate cyclase/phosphodiesterase [Sphingobium sp. SYK-6]
MPDDPDRLPLFILSPRHRDPLSLMANRLGWKPVAARSRERAESRYLGSLARTALLDLRSLDAAQSQAAVTALADAVEASGGAMLVLLDDMAAPHVPDLIASGVTHLLDGEITEQRLGRALQAADKLAERLIGSLAAARNRHAVQRSDALFWRWNGAERTLSISPALAELLQLMAPGVDYSRWTISDLVRALDRPDRAGAIAAIRQAVDDLMPSAFAHSLPGQKARRLVQHLYPDSRGFSGEVEELDAQPRSNSRDRDPMTGLASRQGAMRWFDQVQAAGRQPLAILVGLGEFDRVNSAYGRLVGDAMLARVAMRLTRLVDAMGGRGALVARLTGTEFLVGLVGERNASDALLDRAALLARQIVVEISRPFNAGDFLIRLSSRCGIAPGQDGDSAETILRRASNALADARRGGPQGGIRVRVADDSSRIVDDDRLHSDLRHALDSGQIQILFQPQYDMATDGIIGAEALARWQHPHYGEIGAGALFAIAERSDFILPLSDHIHARALHEAAAWPVQLRSLRLSINVTAADISEPDFLTSFLQLVDESGFSRDRLTVELTESGLVEDLGTASLLLTQLREAGLAVAVDDFGTGYSSLAYLKSLPLDYLKIDSSIARDITGTGRDRIIVRAIIDMARSLDLGVIAEGVETEQQLALLARAGCTSYQGFLRSPPITSAALADLVKGR